MSPTAIADTDEAVPLFVTVALEASTVYVTGVATVAVVEDPLFGLALLVTVRVVPLTAETV